MPGFSKDATVRTPHGNNQYLRSTKGMKFDHGMFGATLIPAATLDGYSTKILKPGTVLAKATSGPQAGYLGVFMAGVTDGRQTPANIVGFCDTFLDWQLMKRDVEVAYVYADASLVQQWCIEYSAGGVPVALTNATRDAILALPGISVVFH